MTDLYSIGILNPWLQAIALNTILILTAWFVPKKLLTPAGLLNAWVLGVVLWGTLRWQGYLIVLFYFLVGSGVTFIGMDQKEAEGIAEERSGARGPGNLWASAFVGTLCALTTLIAPAPYQSLLVLGYVASFSTKLSDTCASEIGKTYGQRTFLITTLKPVPRGTEGAVSLEGTLAGIVASAVISSLGWAIHLISPIEVGLCIIAAFIATNIESVIGATVESKISWLTHDVVNGINTFIGALSAIGLALLFQQSA